MRRVWFRTGRQHSYMACQVAPELPGIKKNNGTQVAGKVLKHHKVCSKNQHQPAAKHHQRGGMRTAGQTPVGGAGKGSGVGKAS